MPRQESSEGSVLSSTKPLVTKVLGYLLAPSASQTIIAVQIARYGRIIGALAATRGLTLTFPVLEHN